MTCDCLPVHDEILSPFVLNRCRFCLGSTERVEWIHSLVRERSLLHCPTRMTVETFIQKPLCWFRDRGNRYSLAEFFCPTKSFHFFVCFRFRSLFLFSVCFSLPLRVFDSTETGCASTTRQMVCEIIWSRFSFWVKQRNKGFYYGTHDIFYRFSGSINTETKLRNRLFWKPKKMKKKTSFKCDRGWLGKVEQKTGIGRWGETNELKRKRQMEIIINSNTCNRTWWISEGRVVDACLYDSFSSIGGVVMGRRNNKMWGSAIVFLEKEMVYDQLNKTHSHTYQFSIPGWWIM